VVVVVFDVFSVADTVSKADGGTFDGNVTMAGTLDVTGNGTVGGTLGVTGVVTANAGIKVDNITIDGSEIDFSSGSFTVDVNENITFDSDTGIIKLADGGTNFGQLDKSGNNLRIISSITDGDIVFRGDDSGSGIDALTLDMSDSGTAIFNNQIQGASGAVSAPTFAFSNDTNTGVSRPTGDTLNFVTGGTERVRINSSGNVGIGSSDPDFLLTVQSSGATTAKIDTSSTSSYAELLLEDGNAGYAFQTRSDNAQSTGTGSLVLNDRDSSSFPIVIKEGNATNTLVLSSSRVGVGTTPITTLHTASGSSGRSWSDGVDRIIHEANGTNIMQIVTTATGTSGINFADTDARAVSGVEYDHNAKSMAISVNEGSGTIKFFNTSERMRIDSSGRVGIGTTSMAEPFRVQADSDTDFSTSSTAFNNAMMLKNSTAGANNCVTLAMATESNGEVYISTVENSDNDAADLRFSIRHSGSRKERLRLMANGRLENQSPSNSGNVLQDFRIDFRNENNAGIMAGIGCVRTANANAPGAFVIRTSTDVDSSSNSSDGEISEKFRVAANGDLTATDTSISSNSDSRLKENISDFSYDLDKFKALKTKTFDWKNPKLHGEKSGQRGFIAQDIETVDDYWIEEIEVPSDSDDFQYLEDKDILYTENATIPDGKKVGDLEYKARFAKTSKLGQKDAMYVSIIQQLITKIETLETKVTTLENA
jgi:hypothetical protein